MKTYADVREVVATIEDRYGEKREVGYGPFHPGKLKVFYKRMSPSLTLCRGAAQLIGKRVRAERTRKGWSMAELAQRAGLRGTPKQRVYEIEKGVRGTGVRLGTLYALALALEIPIYQLLPSTQEVSEFSGVSVGDLTVTTLTEEQSA